MSTHATPPTKPPPLAPGFRFHPTDEELVTYYLKRKLLSKPFPVDAISEVDLYKSEPWDLPGKSLILSRDLEWYFFCRLDRKHVSRFRTNRATASGYWKTTGKDRTVQSGGSVVGMKKTLVFHVGRAPRGERTNWVMHEYRLVDGVLARDGIVQDAYVVCRIFQKSGPGPQNGAQYGAPLLEEEWEDDDQMLTLCGGADGPLVDPGGEQVVQFDDCVQKSQILKIRGETCLAESEDGQDIVRSIDPTDFHRESRDDPVLNEADRCVDLPGQYNDLYLGQNIGLLESHADHSTWNDDYLELDDLATPLDGESPAEGPVYFFNELDMGQTSCLSELHEADEFFDAGDDTPINEEEFLKDILNTSTDEYLCVEQADDDIVYFDALTYNPMVEQDGFVEMSDFMAPMMAGQPAPDPMEELVAYFDDTEAGIGCPYLESPECEDITTLSAIKHSDEVDGSKQTYKSCPRIDAKDVDGASSSTKLPFTSGLSIAQHGDKLVAADPPPYDEGRDKTLKGRLVSMLGSISCPPALAAEMSKSLGLNATASQASNPIHVTAGMIHIDSYIVNGSRIHWSTPKTQDLDILLSFDMARTDIHNDPVSLAILEKMNEGFLSSAVRSGLGLSCFSVVFLALIFEISVHIYTR